MHVSSPSLSHAPSIRRTVVARLLLALLLPVALLAATALPARLPAQDAVIIRGGWIFTSTADTVQRNRGILVRGGKLLVTDGKMSEEDTANSRHRGTILTVVSAPGGR